MAARTQEVEFGSARYRETLALRDAILRQPLGLEMSARDLEHEHREIHLAAVENDAVIACVVLRPLDEAVIKLRQMAVTEAQQGRGVGAELVRFAERIAAERGFTRIEMSARLPAGVFYEKLGYHAEGGEFLEITIPHIKMVKDLV